MGPIARSETRRDTVRRLLDQSQLQRLRKSWFTPHASHGLVLLAPGTRVIDASLGQWGAPRNVLLADVMKRDQTLIPVGMDQEEVALRFQKYALISAAVVDEGGRLVGMITVDDVVHIIQQEAGEEQRDHPGRGRGLGGRRRARGGRVEVAHAHAPQQPLRCGARGRRRCGPSWRQGPIQGRAGRRCWGPTTGSSRPPA